MKEVLQFRYILQNILIRCREVVSAKRYYKQNRYIDVVKGDYTARIGYFGKEQLYYEMEQCTIPVSCFFCGMLL